MNNGNNNLFSEASFPIIATAIGFACAFAYELGYCTYFNIPFQFIELTIPTIILSLLLVFGSCFLLLNFFIVLGSAIPTNTVFGRNIVITIFLLFFPSYLIYIYGFRDWIEYLPVSSIFITYIIILWIWPILINLGKRISYAEKLSISENIDRSTTDLWDIIRRHLGDKTEIIMILLFIVLMAYFRGRAMAKNDKYYYVIETKPALVVLRIYNNKIICAPLNQKNKTINNQYMIAELATVNIKKPLIMSYKNVGPLTLQK